MFEPNADRILALLTPTQRVLDIGGWARPFNRANYVIDSEPYETRGYYGDSRPAQGGDREWFSSGSWIQRDICERIPFPFADKAFDFVICSHTLEDVRDPLWVCSEMIRVGKRGYLEVPSRAVESCRGTEPGQVGWSHHRWLVDIDHGHVAFLMKYHMIHSHWRFALPRTYLRRLRPEGHVQWLFWEDRFDFREVMIHGVENIAAELERFVRQTYPYPKWRLRCDAGIRTTRALANRAIQKLLREARSHCDVSWPSDRDA